MKNIFHHKKLFSALLRHRERLLEDFYATEYLNSSCVCNYAVKYSSTRGGINNINESERINRRSWAGFV